jgi:hypothetical protein
MTFDEITPIKPPQPVAEAEVDAVEAALGARFPAGYREFITRFGRGLTGGLIRIYSPADILSGSNSVKEWRARIDEYWFWDAGAGLLTKARALECVILGDTVGGDELVFHPAAPDRLYVLPREYGEIFLPGEGLEPALRWFFTAGILDTPFEDNSFEPFD